MSKYFLVMENISLTIGQAQCVDGGIHDRGTMKVAIFKKGDIGEFVGESDKNGYFLAKHLDSDDVHDIPYAPAFIKFVGNDLETIRTLYEDQEKEEEADFDFG